MARRLHYVPMIEELSPEANERDPFLWNSAGIKVEDNVLPLIKCLVGISGEAHRLAVDAALVMDFRVAAQRGVFQYRVDVSRIMFASISLGDILEIACNLIESRRGYLGVSSLAPFVHLVCERIR